MDTKGFVPSPLYPEPIQILAFSTYFWVSVGLLYPQFFLFGDFGAAFWYFVSITLPDLSLLNARSGFVPNLLYPCIASLGLFLRDPDASIWMPFVFPDGFQVRHV